MAAHQHLVSPLDLEGWRAAIEEPAWRSGLELQSGLVETILDDAVGGLAACRCSRRRWWRSGSGAAATS